MYLCMGLHLLEGHWPFEVQANVRKIGWSEQLGGLAELG